MERGFKKWRLFVDVRYNVYFMLKGFDFRVILVWFKIFYFLIFEFFEDVK